MSEFNWSLLDDVGLHRIANVNSGCRSDCEELIKAEDILRAQYQQIGKEAAGVHKNNRQAEDPEVFRLRIPTAIIEKGMLAIDEQREQFTTTFAGCQGPQRCLGGYVCGKTGERISGPEDQDRRDKADP